MHPFDEKRSVLIADFKVLYASDFSRAARRYLFVGGASALADWTLFALMLYGFDVHYILAGTISFILATALNYYLSVRFVFGASRRGARNAMMLVYVVSTVGIAINLASLTIGIDYLEVHPLISKLFATSIAVFWNFLARYFYIFK
jgi:putative flippase GtrA